MCNKISNQTKTAKHNGIYFLWVNQLTDDKCTFQRSGLGRYYELIMEHHVVRNSMLI